MRHADRVSEMLNAFSPSPLKIGQMGEFYCDNTMEYRTGDEFCSPIEDIYDACVEAEGDCAFLLLGHKGCGKSTELNRLSERLIQNEYQVRTITCSVDLDLLNMMYSDLFILMGEALLKIAKELDCEIDDKILRSIMNFWGEGTETRTVERAETLDIEAGASAETPGIFGNVLKIFAGIRADLKLNEETRKEYRQKIMVRFSEWIGLLKCVAAAITEKTDGKRPIIIFEDLDKLDPDNAWKVFHNYAAVLSGMSFPVIYTFPIALSYDPKFSAMESFFTPKTLPMVKIETIEGEPFEAGINVIREIVKKRADLTLFDAGVVEDLIKYTGGSLRDLFHAINASAKRATRRGADTISAEDAACALEELKTSLTRRIEQKDYDFLRKIYRGSKEQIEDKDKLLKMLQASVVLEYNGKRWHNVHPLVVKFLESGE